MYRAAYEGHLGDIIAAILPCYWLYYEIGERLKSVSQKSRFITNGFLLMDLIGSEHWWKSKSRLDAIAEKVTEADRNRMKQHFIISSQYEYSFWKWHTLEKWPISTEEKRNRIKRRGIAIHRYESYLCI